MPSGFSAPGQTAPSSGQHPGHEPSRSLSNPMSKAVNKLTDMAGNVASEFPKAAEWLRFFAAAPAQYNSPRTKNLLGGEIAKDSDRDIIPSASVQAVDMEKIDIVAKTEVLDSWCTIGLEILQHSTIQKTMEKWPAPPEKTKCIQMRSEADLKIVTYQDIIRPIFRVLQAYHDQSDLAKNYRRGTINAQAEYGLYGINTKNQEVSGFLDFAMVGSENNRFIQPNGPECPFSHTEVKIHGYFSKILEETRESSTGWGFKGKPLSQRRFKWLAQQSAHYSSLGHYTKSSATDGKHLILMDLSGIKTHKIDFKKEVSGKKKIDLITEVVGDFNMVVLPYQAGILPIFLGFLWEALKQELNLKQEPLSKDSELWLQLNEESTTATNDARQEKEQKKAEKVAKAQQNENAGNVPGPSVPSIIQSPSGTSPGGTTSAVTSRQNPSVLPTSATGLGQPPAPTSKGKGSDRSKGPELTYRTKQ